MFRHALLHEYDLFEQQDVVRHDLVREQAIL